MLTFLSRSTMVRSRHEADNAVVIYDLLKGDVSNYRLEDFLPEGFRRKLERSMSSVEWRKYDPYIQADQTVYVRVPGVDY